MRQSTGPEAGGVFISYRRDEATAYAYLLHDRLNDRLNGGSNHVSVFLDLHEIGLGEDFEVAIRRAVTNCRVLLVLIGPRWASLPDVDGRPRLQDPDDLTRIEVETALQNPDVLVIPVLVDRAAMPRPADLPVSLRGLCRRQALELRHASLQHNIRQLLEAVEQRLRPVEEARSWGGGLVGRVERTPGARGGNVGHPPGAGGGNVGHPPPSKEDHSRAGSPGASGEGQESTKQAEHPLDPTAVAIARVGPVESWDYRWPDARVEIYPHTIRYTVTDGEGHLDVLVARGLRNAYGMARGRIVVFGNSGGASSTYYPWTEFAETDDGEYAAKLYNPNNHRRYLRDGDTLPSWLNPAQVRRNDAVFRSVRHGPTLRLVVRPDDEGAMIRYGYWAATLRRAI